MGTVWNELCTWYLAWWTRTITTQCITSYTLKQWENFTLLFRWHSFTHKGQCITSKKKINSKKQSDQVCALCTLKLSPKKGFVENYLFDCFVDGLLISTWRQHPLRCTRLSTPRAKLYMYSVNASNYCYCWIHQNLIFFMKYKWTQLFVCHMWSKPIPVLITTKTSRSNDLLTHKQLAARISAV